MPESRRAIARPQRAQIVCATPLRTARSTGIGSSQVHDLVLLSLTFNLL
jgi:hypothetical protein